MEDKIVASDFWNARASKITLTVLLLLFISSSTFFALRLKPGIIPDEPYHFSVSKVYSTTWGIPHDTSATLTLGPLGPHPSVFYWINGRILNLLSWIAPTLIDGSQLILLRLLCVMYSAVAIVFVFLFAKEVMGNGPGPLFVVFLLVNTLMFVFLSGGCNYDNLLNLCSFAAIYYLARVFNGKPFFQNSLAWLISILFGGLVKPTILPLAAITGLLWIIYAIKSRHTIGFRFSSHLKTIGISVVCLAMAAMNFALYGGNIIRYGTFFPTCTQLWTQDQCMNDPQFARDQSLSLAKKLSLTEAITDGYPDPIKYALDDWLPLMLARIYGILGHRSYYPGALIALHRLLLLWAIFITIRYWKKPSYAIASAYIILFFYLLVLLQNQYNTELSFGFKTVGLQGRYAFPVIGIYYTLMVYYFLQIPNAFLRKLTFTGASILFLFGSPLIILHRGFNSVFSGWFY